VRRRFVIEVEDGDRVNVGADGGTMFSAGRARLHRNRLVVDFAGSAVVCQVVGDALGLQVVTDREQELCTAIMMLTVASEVDPKVCGAICQRLTDAGFQV
jgi:hypothetical protein